MKTASNVFLLAILVASALVIPRISLDTRIGKAAEEIYPGTSWATATPAEMGLDATKLTQAVNYAGGSGYIIRGGKVVRSWGSATTMYDMRSTTKSIGSIATALAIGDGKLSLDDVAQQKHPSFANPPASNASTGWVPGITLRHLATQTAGFDKDGGYTNLLFKSGTKWSYSDGGANWLAEITTLAHGQDLNTVLFNRVFTPIGIKTTDLTWRANQYRGDTINGIKNREFGSGIRANVNAMARIGYLYLRNGKWNANQLVPQSYINLVNKPQPGLSGIPEHFPSIAYNGSDHYGLLWWNNADSTLPNAPEDTYWAWGLGESLIVVYPSLDIVAVRAGSALQPQWEPNYNVVKPFIEPIAQAVTLTTPTPAPTQGQTPPPSGGTVIDIYATAIGSPRMELKINDQTVSSFNVVGSGNKYSYTNSNLVSVDQIKVAFVNDSSANDLTVDRIVVNGTTYQSEAPTTFSTGVYANGKCQSQGGYFMKEKLSCNGYFRYGNSTQTSTPVPTPTSTPRPSSSPIPSPSPTVTPLPTGGDGVSSIDIYASAVGSPRMELKINDVTVKSFNVTGGTTKYSYTSTITISPSQVKVAFVNDSALNDLIVDRVVINGNTYQSEASTTFSTGVYASGKCQSQGGYFKKEKLSCNGYFRYVN